MVILNISYYKVGEVHARVFMNVLKSIKIYVVVHS